VDPRRNYPPDPGNPDPDQRWFDERAYGPSHGPAYSPDYTGSGYDPFAPPEPLPPLQPAAPPISGAGPANGSTPTGDIPLEDYSRHRAESIDREELRRSAAPMSASMSAPPMPAAQLPTQMTSQVPAPTGGSVYHGKRPGLAIGLIVLTVIFELPVLRIFFSSVLVKHVNPQGTFSSIFMLLGLPMFALGLYGLIGGAAATANGARAWLRVPLAYLPVGLLLFLAAALA
jgi:hypothetical protein